MKAAVFKHTYKLSPRRHLSHSTVMSTLLMLALLIQAGLFGEAHAGVASSAEVERRDAMEYFFHQSFNNLDEELEIDEEEDKKGVFIMFTDKDCPWCLKMNTTIMNRADVKDYYREHFSVLTIDINVDKLMTDF